jgi:hypothetical protein
VTGAVDDVVGRATTLTDALRETLTTGRGASLRRAEHVAEREGEPEVADAVAATRRETGDLSADELPIEGYDSMSTTQVAAAVKRLRTADEVTAVIRYEETHKRRTGVVNATQARMAALAKEAVGVPEE